MRPKLQRYIWSFSEAGVKCRQKQIANILKQCLSQKHDTQRPPSVIIFKSKQGMYRWQSSISCSTARHMGSLKPTKSIDDLLSHNFIGQPPRTCHLVKCHWTIEGNLNSLPLISVNVSPLGQFHGYLFIYCKVFMGILENRS